MGFTDFLKSLFGDKSQRDIKKLEPIVAQVNAIMPTLKDISNDELRAKVTAVKQRLKEATAAKRNKIDELKAEIQTLEYDQREPLWEQIDKLDKEILDILEDELKEVLPEVFALVRETAQRFKDNETIEVTASAFDRELAAAGHDFLTIEGDKALYRNHWKAGGNEITWDMVHYDCQLMGGVVLNGGKIAEMATGEGKTLVATLPVFLNALTGNGVHVVTVNDYLAKRDSEWMGPLYMFHGLSVGCIDKTQPNTPERRAAYNCDITFGTNNEFGFDYLRDNMATVTEDLVQRRHNFAIVDEVDSVLIDDARTPLIISGPVPKGDDQLFNQFKPNVEKVVNAQRRLVTELLSQAKQKIESENKEEAKEGALLLYRAFKGLPKNGALIKFLSKEGIKPKMLETEAFYMQDNSRDMHIVTDPLYFIIDEKNRSVELTDKGIDVLTGTSDDPNFFVLPDIASILSEIEGNTAISDEERQARKDEAMSNYAIKAERVHTVNQLLKAYTLFELNVEYVIDDNKVKIVDEQTGRIMEGRRYSDGLHQAIEAKEGVNVEAATQTFATITLQNYFRMYHKLSGMTGTAETEAGEFWDIYKLEVVTIPTNKPVQRVDMPDRVYKTKREKYEAVIAEIEEMVRIGRPVLVGTTSVEISELLSRMLTMRHIPHNVLNAKLHQKEADIVAQAGRKGVVTIATNMAGRGTDIKLTPEVKAAGGLAIIGTERHESRRVDRQLRGRSGRQGDPGSSVFYVSFEDNLMRMFVSDKVVKMLDRMGLKEGERIESSMFTNAIENAQKRVEENNFGIRKRLLEYDDVMNSQRNVIYTRRHHALKGERIGLDIMNMLYEKTESLIQEYKGFDFDELKYAVLRIFAMDVPFNETEYKAMDSDEATQKLFEAVKANFKRRSENLCEVAMPFFENFMEQVKANPGIDASKVMVRVPIKDGRRIYGIPTNLVEAYDSKCKSMVRDWQKHVVLMTIDEAWKEHLRELDQLRQSVQNASYEQKDPLLIYKLESFNLFKTMVDTMNEKAVSILMRGAVNVQEQPTEAKEPLPSQQRKQQYVERKDDYAEAQAAQRKAASQAGAAAQRPRTPIVAVPKVGRNEPCPCGSGKKYKNCHGANNQ